MRSSSAAIHTEGEVPHKTGLLALGISALGVVYGDIGTSPLYALKETFFGAHPLARNLENVLGVLSLVFWTLLLIVGVKYVLLVLRADFHGEGGIFALLGIIRNKQPQNGKPTRLLLILTTAVMIGAAALYGDAVIYSVVVLATMATVIASQALISGAYSMTRQGIALGFFPRLQIISTSAEIEGQLYIPAVNWLLLTGCMLLVIGFKTSSALAAAYGLAVTGTMAITSFIFYFVAQSWGWKRYWIGPVCLGFLFIDLSYFLANTLKFFDGGYVPIMIALCIFSLMQTWQWGRAQLADAFSSFLKIPLRRYLELKQQIMDSPHLRTMFGMRSLSQVERAVVFLTSRPVLSPDDPCPIGLRIYIRRNGAIPKHVILLNVAHVHQPVVPDEKRYDVIPLGANIVAINARYGYMQRPDVPSLLRTLKNKKLIKINENRWTIQVGEEEILIDPSLRFFRRLMLRFFIFIMRFTNSADRYFGLRDFAGRNKTVIPVLIGHKFASVTVLDSEPADQYPVGTAPLK
ncbi:MAG: KUP/HAK/KT family potassium transporter [Proteobacteria bacterium]|nr:KUP/HAK/KT family potassium transporter [Pseudomonadota bacterium]